ncbi:hypothetical protein Misp01_25130 [Microtetraspora sp. NBRC 13810]|nr:hypothetical protein Misp01_25130 [Microtetraspora sp. NBRC 13810]
MRTLPAARAYRSAPRHGRPHPPAVSRVTPAAAQRAGKPSRDTPPAPATRRDKPQSAHMPPTPRLLPTITPVTCDIRNRTGCGEPGGLGRAIR